MTLHNIDLKICAKMLRHAVMCWQRHKNEIRMPQKEVLLYNNKLKYYNNNQKVGSVCIRVAY